MYMIWRFLYIRYMSTSFNIEAELGYLELNELEY